MGVAARSETLEDVHVECTHCGLRMTAHLGSGQRIRYFRCGGCQRWVSSAYADIFRADAKVRTHPKKDEATEDRAFEDVKARLERWLTALEEQDPYRLLGLSPLATPKEVRERYRELAFRVHPDRGGSAERMRELNLAYERILHHQERRRSTTLPANSPADSTVLPARSR
ncbi:MAG: J domain-containing protein [Myxococcaceae bacterium]